VGRLRRARKKLAAADFSDTAALTAADSAESNYYNAVAAEIQALERTRDSIFRMLPGNGRAPVRLSDDAEPGAWLARVVQRHALTTDDIGSTTTPPAVVPWGR
jgi:hypothetical protein